MNRTQMMRIHACSAPALRLVPSMLGLTIGVLTIAGRTIADAVPAPPGNPLPCSESL